MDGLLNFSIVSEQYDEAVVCSSYSIIEHLRTKPFNSINQHYRKTTVHQQLKPTINKSPRKIEP